MTTSTKIVMKMKKLKIGIMPREQYQERVIAIASGKLKPKPGEPKIWFSSLKSVAQILSEENVQLLKVIASEQPESISELAEITGRQRSNLTRTLNTMTKYGIVDMVNINKKVKKPVAKAFEFDIQYAVA